MLALRARALFILLDRRQLLHQPAVALAVSLRGGGERSKVSFGVVGLQLAQTGFVQPADARGQTHGCTIADQYTVSSRCGPLSFLMWPIELEIFYTQQVKQNSCMS